MTEIVEDGGLPIGQRIVTGAAGRAAIAVICVATLNSRVTRSEYRGVAVTVLMPSAPIPADAL